MRIFGKGRPSVNVEGGAGAVAVGGGWAVLRGIVMKRMMMRGRVASMLRRGAVEAEVIREEVGCDSEDRDYIEKVQLRAR